MTAHLQLQEKLYSNTSYNSRKMIMSLILPYCEP